MLLITSFYQDSTKYSCIFKNPGTTERGMTPNTAGTLRLRNPGLAAVVFLVVFQMTVVLKNKVFQSMTERGLRFLKAEFFLQMNSSKINK